MLKDLVVKNRSVRRYDQSIKVSRETLLELVDSARISNSAGNRQPLKFFLSYTPEKNARIYKYIGLAGQPPEGSRPSAYIIILVDSLLSSYGGVNSINHNIGIAAEVILLGATEKGLGGCMIGMIDHKGLQRELQLSDRYEIGLVLTIGKPKETHVFEVAGTDSAEITGWWDEQGVRHIPKRRLEDIIME
ncbi:MAG: nitroreductase family protein [Dehalococcoidales bacterium]|nr:nitroreductase family protein [Dehalococcoidales bacterium]